MASELQRIATGLLECFGEMGAVAATLRQAGRESRQDADALAQLSRTEGGLSDVLTKAITQLEEAGKRCLGAADTGERAAREARSWAEQHAGVLDTAETGVDNSPTQGSAGPDSHPGQDHGSDARRGRRPGRLLRGLHRLARLSSKALRPSYQDDSPLPANPSGVSSLPSAAGMAASELWKLRNTYPPVSKLAEDVADFVDRTADSWLDDDEDEESENERDN